MTTDQGHDGLRQYAQDLTKEWEQVRFAFDEIREAGDQVVLLAHFHARGRAAEAELTFVSAWSERCGREKIVEARMYSDPAEALKPPGCRGRGLETQPHRDSSPKRATPLSRTPLAGSDLAE